LVGCTFGPVASNWLIAPVAFKMAGSLVAVFGWLPFVARFVDDCILLAGSILLLRLHFVAYLLLSISHPIQFVALIGSCSIQFPDLIYLTIYLTIRFSTRHPIQFVALIGSCPIQFPDLIYWPIGFSTSHPIQFVAQIGSFPIQISVSIYLRIRFSTRFSCPIQFVAQVGC
jgi:hypothetical protein